MAESKKKHLDSGWSKEALVKVDDWLDEDNLLLIAGWTRDGYTYKDIARKIGIGTSTFNTWRNKYPQFNEAMKQGREIVDYKVENALLKSALGYETKETKVTVLMRYGKVVEEQTETVTKEVVPNVAAIQTWLYNRLPEKWNRRNGNLAEDLSDDDSIRIEVTRAKRDELNETSVEGSDSDGDSWSASVNESLTLRKATESEREAKKQSEGEEVDLSVSPTTVEGDEWDDMEEPFDEDYWPEDDEWEAMKAARKQSEAARSDGKKGKQAKTKKKGPNNWLSKRGRKGLKR